MHIPIFQVVHAKLATGSPQVALLKEVASEFSRVVWPVEKLSDSKNPQIKLSPLNKQRVGDVLLDYELSHIMSNVFTCCGLNKLSDLI